MGGTEQVEGSIHIVCDLAESTSGIPRILDSMSGVTTELVRLEAGDYLIGNSTCVERKSCNDFVMSILDGRLPSQVRMMNATFAKVVILIEGQSIYQTQHRVADVALHGAMSWLAFLEGVSFIYSRSPADSAGLIGTIARHATHGLGYEVPLRTNKPKLITYLQSYLIEGLPSVGPSKAAALLNQFKSAAGVFAATEVQIGAVPGIGPKTARKIYETLQAPWTGGL